MKLDVIKLDGKKAGSVDLGDEIFGLEPRADILHRVVRWQRNNAQAGTHKVKTRSETSYSTKKIYRQKGTGGARHGDRNAPIFRKGGIYKGPTPAQPRPRPDQEVPQAGSSPCAVVESRDREPRDPGRGQRDGSRRPRHWPSRSASLGWKRALIIDGAAVNENFVRAAAQHRRSGRAAVDGRECL